jgi:hypothetical protein
MIDPFPRPFLVGMVHLGALPGSAAHCRSLDGIIEDACRDAVVLRDAGFDAILIENFGDAPFVADRLHPATIASMTLAAKAVRDAVAIPLGVNCLRNDAASALSIADAVGAVFIRVNVHCGVAATDQGVIEGRAADTLTLRRRLNAGVAIVADVHVKHATAVNQPDLAEAAKETAYRGRADALVVSGPATGMPTVMDDLSTVKSAVPDRPLFVGSGATEKTIRALLDVADGVIVGSSIKVGGRTSDRVDADRAKAFLKAAGR